MLLSRARARVCNTNASLARCGQERHHFVVAQDHLAPRVDDHPDVEVAPRELLVAGLGLGHDEDVPLARELAKSLGLRSRNVDRALARVLLMVGIHHLVGEALQRALRDRHQSDRQVKPPEPERGLDQVLEVIEVLRDLLAAAYAPHGGHEPDRLVGLSHAGTQHPASAVRLSNRRTAPSRHRHAAVRALRRVPGAQFASGLSLGLAPASPAVSARRPPASRCPPRALSQARRPGPPAGGTATYARTHPTARGPPATPPSNAA